MKNVTNNINARVEVVESKQTDERGLIDELTTNIRNENRALRDEILVGDVELKDKTKKFHWFEMKLNKWIRLFETSEEENANRHNTLISNINEVDN